MDNPETIFNPDMFSDSQINRINVFTGCQMTVDTLYLNSGQVLEYTNTSNNDKCIFFFKGNGKCYLSNNTESVIDVTEGSIVYIPSGVSYKIQNSDNPMIAVESTSATQH